MKFFFFFFFFFFWFFFGGGGGLPTLKQPKCSWPSERTGVSRLRPTTLRLCPCDFLMVIAQLSLTGNCNLFNSTGSHLYWG